MKDCYYTITLLIQCYLCRLYSTVLYSVQCTCMGYFNLSKELIRLRGQICVVLKGTVSRDFWPFLGKTTLSGPHMNRLKLYISKLFSFSGRYSWKHMSTGCWLCLLGFCIAIDDAFMVFRDTVPLIPKKKELINI